MKIPVYGYLHPLTKGPSFVIPLFGTDEPPVRLYNDAKGLICAFEYVQRDELGDFCVMRAHDGTRWEIELGGPAVYGFEFPDGSLVFSGYKELAKCLVEKVDELRDYPFLTLEVLRFQRLVLGKSRPELWDDALRRAAELLGLQNGQVAADWQKLQSPETRAESDVDYGSDILRDESSLVAVQADVSSPAVGNRFYVDSPFTGLREWSPSELSRASESMAGLGRAAAASSEDAAVKLREYEITLTEMDVLLVLAMSSVSLTTRQILVSLPGYRPFITKAVSQLQGEGYVTRVTNLRNLESMGGMTVQMTPKGRRVLRRVMPPILELVREALVIDTPKLVLTAKDPTPPVLSWLTGLPIRLTHPRPVIDPELRLVYQWRSLARRHGATMRSAKRSVSESSRRHRKE